MGEPDLLSVRQILSIEILIFFLHREACLGHAHEPMVESLAGEEGACTGLIFEDVVK